MTAKSKAAVLADRAALAAVAAEVPRRTQRSCPNCGATAVRVDWVACCWNPRSLAAGGAR